jgi:hypothetical protein
MTASDRNPSYFSSKIQSGWSNGRGLRDNGMGWNAIGRRITNRMAKMGRRPTPLRVVRKHLLLILTYTEPLKPAESETMRQTPIAVLLACSLATAVTSGQTQKESAPPASNVKVGSVAPDFTLVDQSGQPHSLHDYRGKKNVIVAFYLWAFSPT